MRLRPLTLGFVLWAAGCSTCPAVFPSRVLAAETQNPGALVIHAAVASKPPKGLGFSVAGQSPDGHMLSANTRYLTRDGKPWFPVMGEFHFSRYPETGWEKEILKMKAGGIQVISTYIFWIHHEEIEGQFDWAGQRDVRRFIELCGKHGMVVWIRIGPWAHGEVRNGGLPDWLTQKTATRESNPAYLDAVRLFYGEIAKQLKGLFWKDGGPILGMQIENEYSARGKNKGAAHLVDLRQIARDAGLEAPFYSVTAWDNAAIPARDFLPVFGGYADGFWWHNQGEQPPNPNYFFTLIRCEENVGDDLRSKHPEMDPVQAAFPYLTAEMGGGMALSYHRRPRLTVDDTAAMAVVKLGSGAVLYGYYMFHGGTNPEGKKTTLQESQATGYANDLPVKSYDFQAPIGEFGQMNPSFSALKTLDLFLSDFGASLAPMTPYFPERLPTSKADTATPRVAARLDGDHGFVFLNNHERTYHLPEHANFQVRLDLSSGTLDVPRHPVTLPSDAYTIWPVNLDLGGIRLRYATAQLLCKLDDPHTFVFFAWPGIPVEFAVKDETDMLVESRTGRVLREGGTAYVEQVEPGSNGVIRIRGRNNAWVNILVLSREQALTAWKAPLAGRERLILSSAQLYFEPSTVHLAASDPAQLKAAFFPNLDHTPNGFGDGGKDGVFAVYSAQVQPVPGQADVQPLRAGATAPRVKLEREVARIPEDSAFDTAASWRIRVPRSPSTVPSSVFLEFNYDGDIARLYADGKLVTDNFYDGAPWLVGLDRIPRAAWDKLELKILPLREDAPIYLPEGAHPAFPASGQVANLKNVQVVREYEVTLEAKP
jgi:beta-galactosidase